MQVAVAEVAEGEGARARKRLLRVRMRARDEFRNLGNGHGNVVLDRHADAALHLREHLAHLPERLALGAALGNGRILDHAALEPFAENRFHRVAQAALRLR